MKSFVIAFAALATCGQVAASTWTNDGTELEWTPGLWAMFNEAERCTGDGGYDDVASVYQHFDQATGFTIFTVYDDGRVVAMKDMQAERTSLDYCL